MDELLLGLLVGSFIAFCLYYIRKTVRQSKERKQKRPQSNMTWRERRFILVTSLIVVTILILGVGAFFVL